MHVGKRPLDLWYNHTRESRLNLISNIFFTAYNMYSVLQIISLIVNFKRWQLDCRKKFENKYFWC